MATSRAVAAVKRTKVVEAAAGGAAYEQAARHAGYATRSGAYKAFWAAMDTHEAKGVDMHREIELQRLDALQRSLWDKAMDGDVKAVNAIARIIDRRVRLLGLDKHTGCRHAGSRDEPGRIWRCGRKRRGGTCRRLRG